MRKPSFYSSLRALSLALVFGALVVLSSPGLTLAFDTKDTKFLTQPAVSASGIVFVYANDLWTADLDGKNVRRLTSDVGVESAPAFSPDGSLIAFSGQYDGNTDVYVVPASGGIPKRLTWHPGADVVQGFTPDGKSVVFVSARNSAVRSYAGLYTILVEGGVPVQHPIPYASRAAFSADGKFVAYNPFGDAFLQWKHYRGGTHSRVWIFDNAGQSIEKVPQPAGRSNDAGPMWLGSKVCFRSDRNGEFNLFSYDRATKEVKQLTFYKDYPVLNASAGAGRIVYEQAGVLHLYDVAANSDRRLAIGVSTDLPELRARYAKGPQWVRSLDVSPTGARALLGFRGEVVTVPAEKGDPRNLTNTPGVYERAPVWSPDGKLIAYFSDASGEYELHVRPQDGKGEVKAYKLSGSGYYSAPAFSPDSQKIAFADNSLTLYWLDLKTGAQKKVGSEYLFQPIPPAEMASAWSPDSKWIAYTISTQTFFRRVYVYSLDHDKSFPVTDGLSDATGPVFDPSGKYLFFFASTDAGPALQWFDQSNADFRETSALYMAVLRKDLPNPLAKESDEEKAAADDAKKDEKPKDAAPAAGGKPGPAKPASPAPAAAPAADAFRIDFDGLEHRIVAVPIPAGIYGGLKVGETGKIYYLAFDLPANLEALANADITGEIHLYDLAERKDEVLTDGVNAFILTADKKKMLISGPNMMAIVPAAGKAQPGQGRLNVGAVEVRVDPAAEWRQMFDEAWRINRDFFYDPGMHGADWKAMKAKYEGFLADVPCRADLNRLIQWMCSELVVGHHRVGGGDLPNQPKTVPGGLLGADYAIDNGRYRIRKVYGGLNWNPELRSPLDEPGVDVKAGEYLLAVNGKDLRAPDNLYARFENTAGKIVEITVGPNPDGTKSRVVRVVPVANEGGLRNRDWVEGNLRKVEAATGGRVAYVYVPNTTTTGYVYFKRYFFPQADKDAIIVDERFNGGGQVADYYIDWLRKPVVAYWAMRFGINLKTPSSSIQGPKVMLINESAGSGGDLLPWMWRKFGLGKLIGTRTWGGLVGILGFPELMDGGFVTAPNLGVWTEDGFVVENEGVPADIEVEQTPKDVIAGHDPQLEKAIQVVLDELAKNPPKKPARPPFPVRVHE